MPDKSHQIGDGPISEDMREMMNNLARGIDIVLNGDQRPKQVGFVLMAFPFGSTDGRCNYISNGAPADMKVLFTEQLARMEARMAAKEGRA